MHHKVFVIDNKIVITGSFNPSENGNTNNDENVLILENLEIAKLYLEEFEKVYIPLPEEGEEDYAEEIE